MNVSLWGRRPQLPFSAAAQSAFLAGPLRPGPSAVCLPLCLLPFLAQCPCADGPPSTLPSCCPAWPSLTLTPVPLLASLTPSPDPGSGPSFSRPLCSLSTLHPHLGWTGGTRCDPARAALVPGVPVSVPLLPPSTSSLRTSPPHWELGAWRTPCPSSASVRQTRSQGAPQPPSCMGSALTQTPLASLQLRPIQPLCTRVPTRPPSPWGAAGPWRPLPLHGQIPPKSCLHLPLHIASHLSPPARDHPRGSRGLRVAPPGRQLWV